MLMEGKREWFHEINKFENNPIDVDYYKQDEKSYEEIKKKFEQKFLECLYKVYPETLGNIESIAIGTPWTNRRFLGAISGESYGLEWSPTHFHPKIMNQLHACTNIDGLYLVGEASYFGGLLGAIISSWITLYHQEGLIGVMKSFLL